MRLSLHEVLAIVGRLDDAPGFDTPRKRFRRFLTDHMTSVAVARVFLDEAQQLISEQYQRALQDTVLVAGQLLGFEINFGGYERHGSAARSAGQWLSRRRVAVTVQVWSDSAASDQAVVDHTLDSPLLRADGVQTLARLCVVTPSCAGRHRLEESVRGRPEPTRIMSLRTLMELLTVASTPHVTHDDIVRLLSPTPALEGAVSLLTRLVHPSRPPAPAIRPDEEVVTKLTSCWVYVVKERDAVEPRPGVADVLHMTLPAGDSPSTEAGDSVAFLVPSKGVVAHARVATVNETTEAVDEAHSHFSVGLSEIVIVDPPHDIGTEQRLNLELQAAVTHESYVRVGRREFDELTRVGATA